MWAVAGQSVASKQEHNALWKDMLKAYAENKLWSDVELEAAKITSWPVSGGMSGSSASASSTANGPKRKRGS